MKSERKTGTERQTEKCYRNNKEVKRKEEIIFAYMQLVDCVLCRNLQHTSHPFFKEVKKRNARETDPPPPEAPSALPSQNLGGDGMIIVTAVCEECI
jgi:hypothetical protein